jgi:phosphotransferase family enzyme
MSQPLAGAFPRHNWLAAVVPANAHRFSVRDPKLALTLADAGAEIVDSSPDVRIVPDLFHHSGEPEMTIVTIEATPVEGRSRLPTVSARVYDSTWSRLRAIAGRRALRRAGYRFVETILWEWEQLIRITDAPNQGRELSIVERFPRAALVVGTRDKPPATLLEAALKDATARTGRVLELSWPLVRQGGIVLLAREGVVRVAVGPARREIERARTALEAIRQLEPPAAVRERVPVVLGFGRVALAEWALEERLPGVMPRLPLENRLLGDCLDFLVALHEAGRAFPATRRLLADDAEVVSGYCTRELAPAVRALGARLDVDLAEVPRGFGHGDFWRHNLLSRSGRLVGVVDWHGAGAERLPLVDLMHLRLSAVFEPRRQYLGSALVEHLLPWARSGGDEFSRTYCERIGLRLAPGQLEDLALSYWLTRTARELESYADRAERPVWIQNNVDRVARAISEESSGRRR